MAALTEGKGEAVEKTEGQIRRLTRFIEAMEANVYPEPPSQLHDAITEKALAILFEKCPLKKEARILDVGCGQGPALRLFKERGFDAVGITLSDEDVISCRDQGFAVVKMDQSFLDFPDAAFDLVWARHVAEHSLFPLFTLHEFNRVLKSGGYLYLEVPAPDTSCHHERNLNHYSVLTRSSWQVHLQRLGMKIILSQKYSFTVPAGPDEYWAYYCGKP
jgi:SAM-dependent methyltransferase